MGKEYKPGSSLKVWKEYFFNANIFGADIDKDILFQEERIKTFFVDQLDEISIKDMWKKLDLSNDLIIDDGIHTLDGCKIFFDNSIEYLKDDGIYIIEDVDPIFLNELNNHLIKKYTTSIIKLNFIKLYF